MSTVALPVGAGLVFGVALTASEVYLPSVIMAQMELKSFHMMSVFLVASASSAIVMAAFEHFNIVHRQPRPESSIGWYGPYDANVLGGLLIGAGMTLTGACPGTVLVQIATGIQSGFPALIGGLLGGIAFVRYGNALKRNLAAQASSLEAKDRTVQTKFDINPNHVLLAYEVLCTALIGAFTVFGLSRTTPLLHPTVSGTLIGGAQATSLLLTGKAIGVSTAYEEAGRWLWHFMVPIEKRDRALPSAKVLPFTMGLFVGSLLLSHFIIFAPAEKMGIGPLRAVLGGFTMVFGSRLAGGCTSGHGISGMSSFSIASIISVVAMFAGGILTARLLDVGG